MTQHTVTPCIESSKPRLVWIDIAKAIGLFLVVAGHLTINKYSVVKYIYWFHVPLFFIISGMLHSSTSKIITFIIARFKHLMIPYCAFVCCALIMIVTGPAEERSVINLLLGGQFLRGTACLKWWFIPCLFFTQIAGFIVIKMGKTRFILYAAILSYFAAEIFRFMNTVFIWGTPFPLLKVPLSLEIVPMALVFYLAGFLLKDKLLSITHLPLPITALLSFAMTTVILLDWFNVLNIPYYFMSIPDYGLPLFNIVFPLISFLLIRELSITLIHNNLIKITLVYIGQAALPIIFLHLILPVYAVKALLIITGLDVGNLIIRFTLGILIPVGIYYLLKKNKFTKKILLGEWR